MPWTELERVVAPKETGPADRLARLMTGLPHAQVRGLFDHGCVTVNGEPCPLHALPLAVGDRLRIRYEAQRRYREKPRVHEPHAFRIVFEDAHLLVVDKAAGVLTVPTERDEPTALVYALSRYLSRGPRLTRRVTVVHRLDRDTSGLLVFAKRREVAEALKHQFRDRKPEREYAAIVAGRLDKPRGTIEGYLATDPSLNQYTTHHAERGKLAITHYEVLREVQGASLVRVRLETGRRNQIRVHFAERGHPVLGDVRYEPARAMHPRWRARRLALHASVLGFTHPETERRLRFESPLPPEFVEFLGPAAEAFAEAVADGALAPGGGQAAAEIPAAPPAAPPATPPARPPRREPPQALGQRPPRREAPGRKHGHAPRGAQRSAAGGQQHAAPGGKRPPASGEGRLPAPARPKHRRPKHGMRKGRRK